jgi:hypothetical protein
LPASGLGLGPFASTLNLGIWPVLFSLAMLAFSVVLGIVCAALNSWRHVGPPRAGLE